MAYTEEERREARNAAARRYYRAHGKSETARVHTGYPCSYGAVVRLGRLWSS